MKTLELAPAIRHPKAGDDENHEYCCNPDVSLCGLDISDLSDDDFDDEECCPACADLWDLPCGPECKELDQDGGAA
ncbi:hypothetical protein ABZ917_17940 [Nonomuraea wenchangensis]